MNTQYSGFKVIFLITEREQSGTKDYFRSYIRYYVFISIALGISVQFLYNSYFNAKVYRLSLTVNESLVSSMWTRPLEWRYSMAIAV